MPDPFQPLADVLTPAEDFESAVRAVGRYVHAADRQAIAVVLATAVSCYLEHEPLWTLLVGGPSSAKTELIRLVAGVAHETVDELTGAPALLSYTKTKDPKPAGLLTRLPRNAFVTIADFSTLLAGSDKGGKDATFALLRRAHDGSVTREIGQSATPLRWKGRLTLLAAVTPSIDSYSSHSDALGPRWIYSRLPALGAGERQAALALGQRIAAKKPHLRRQALEITTRVVGQAQARLEGVRASEDGLLAVNAAAIVTAIGRAAVPRDGYRREVQGDVTREEPMRVGGQLAVLYQCLLALKINDREAVTVVCRCALDSMPPVRRRVLAALSTGETFTSAALAREVEADRKVVRLALEDLLLIGVTRYAGDDSDDGDEDPRGRRQQWYLSGPERQLIVDTFAHAKWDENREAPTHPPAETVDQPPTEARAHKLSSHSTDEPEAQSSTPPEGLG